VKVDDGGGEGLGRIILIDKPDSTIIFCDAATALFSATTIFSADTTETSKLAQVLASMASVTTDYISVGGNRHPGAADWDVQSGVLAFGADNNVALWEPLVWSIECSGIALAIL
jgi:elongator complex protein 2